MPTAPFLNTADPSFDFASPEVEHAREQHWFAHTPRGPVVLRHAESVELLKDGRLGLDGRRFMRMNGVAGGPLYEWWTAMIRNRRPEDHLRLRSVAARALSPGRVLALRPQIRALAESLAQALPSQEIVDFAERFSSPYASGVIARLLGVPDEDHERFRLMSKDAGLVFVWSDLPAVLPIVERAIIELGEFIHELFERKSRHAGEDLVSYLVDATAKDDTLSREEAEHLVLDIAWAGQESVARQLGRALIAFRAHPGQWEAVAGDPGLAERAADEALRWAPQIRNLFRFALEGLCYRDLSVERGELVMFCPPSASRDPRAYDKAAEFDIAASRDNRHLVFGGGVFRCLGSVLAKLELEEALAALAPEFRCPTLPDPATWRAALPMVNLRDALPILWERRAARRSGSTAAAPV